MKQDKIIVSDTSYNSNDPYDLILSNISVVNLLNEEGFEPENRHEDSIISYYLDYYLAQYSNGNFSQFVWNSGWSPELNRDIEEGLKKTGAQKNLILFLEQCTKVENLEEGELEKYLKSEYFGPNKTRDKLKNSSFYSLEEDLIVLHSQWLRNHPDLQVLPVEEMFSALEKLVGRKIERS
ncbi:DMP19 family protein [Chryseobacterium sp. MYb328]|uniref:DMP19 family protein n=1 Tax=Chryseobacterium sp. MYb328 TaxID=2745231 RepID=UPI0030A7B366